MILVIGSYGAGITAQIPRLPEAGETIADTVVSFGHGGKGSNQAVAMARQGAQVEFVTALGPDSFADAARALWKTEGIGYSRVKSVAQSTMAGIILVEPTGENRIAIAPGALNELEPADVDALSDVIKAAELVVTCLEIPARTVERIIQVAHEQDTPVLVNPAPATELNPDVLALANYVIFNQTEYAFFNGLNYRPPQGQVVITTLGAEGARVERVGDTSWTLPGMRQSAVVDTTGAGDTFVGTLAAGIAAGAELRDAVQRAIVASSLSVTVREVIPSIPMAQQVDDVMQQYVRD